MSCHCNVSNEEFSKEEWSRIEGVCKEYKMLNDVSLQECIARDEKVIYDAGLTFTQLDDLFESLQLIFHQSKAAKVPVTESESKMDNRHFPNFADLPRDGWMPKSATMKKIMLFEHEYTVKMIVWRGAQTCPFQNFDLDKRYHGYDYGASDYLLFREDLDMGLHMGSLLFHQIAKHHFFQVSPYRVDPAKLIHFFSLKPGVSYKVPVKHVPTRYWCGCSSGDPSTILEDTKRWELVTTTDDYYFFKRVQIEGEEPAYSKFCIAARHERCPLKVMIDDIEHEIAWTIVNYTDRIIMKTVLVE